MSTITYIKNFIKDPKVASITPTSPFGVRRVCSKIDFEHARVIVEYGPGTGVITKQLLERMRPDARLILIERNENFVSILREELPDPRVHVLLENAENVRAILDAQGIRQVDYVISGIPFSWLTESLRDQIIGHSAEVLRPGGKFLAYQTLWQADAHLLDHLARHFELARSEYELRNAPPLRIYEAQKHPVRDARRKNGRPNGRSKNGSENGRKPH